MGPSIWAWEMGLWTFGDLWIGGYMLAANIPAPPNLNALSDMLDLCYLRGSHVPSSTEMHLCSKALHCPKQA